MILKHDLKEADAVQSIYITCANRQNENILNKKAKCPFILNKESKCPFILTRRPICTFNAHLATIVYNERLSRTERVNFDVGFRRFICYNLCDIQHVKFSREMTSLVLKPFGSQFV